MENPALSLFANGDENDNNVVANNNGGNGNVVAHSQAPVNVGSRNGVGITENVPTMQVPPVPNGSANSHGGSSGVITTWSEDCGSVTNDFDHNRGKAKRKLKPELVYVRKVKGHYDANRHPGEKVEDNFARINGYGGWLDE